jgi:hypothetical protein
MSRRLVPVLLALTVLIACASPIALASNQTPVLGWNGAFPNGKGFGTVKPRTVYLGGDPTGDISSIAWHHWGQARTVGFGQGWCPGRSVASGRPCPAALHISNLGTCHGLHAYRTLVFYFKSGARRKCLGPGS